LIAATQVAMIQFNLGQNLETDIDSNLHDATASAIRLNINYRLTDSITGEDATICAGIAWISENAAGVGGTSLPDPSSDHHDWMWHDIRTLSASRDVAGIDEQVPGSHITIVNNSMRKQRENNSRLSLIFRATLLQPTSVQVFVGGRVLFLNP